MQGGQRMRVVVEGSHRSISVRVVMKEASGGREGARACAMVAGSRRIMSGCSLSSSACTSASRRAARPWNGSATRLS